MSNLTPTTNWVSVPEFKTDDKFHWVLSGSSIILADENNNILYGPSFLNLSKEEKQLIEGLNLFSLVDITSRFSAILCRPEHSKKTPAMITAPFYVTEIKAGHIHYRKEEDAYTAPWADPRDVKFICEFIKSNIPSDKIADYGCYVKDI